MKNLLVPTDFPPESHHAFEVALHLARRASASVTLLHVVEVPETTNFSTHGCTGLSRLLHTSIPKPEHCQFTA